MTTTILLSEQVPDWDLIIKIIGLIVPLITAYIGYILGYQSKKKEHRLQQKSAAFKEIHKGLAEFKQYLLAVVSQERGSDFSLIPKEGESSLTHRENLLHLFEYNAVYLKKRSRTVLEDFIGEISLLNNAELNLASGSNPDINWMEGYEPFADKVDTVIETLYNDLNN